MGHTEAQAQARLTQRGPVVAAVLAAALAAAAPAAAGPRVVDPQAVSLGVTERVVLGDTAGTEITVIARKKDGAPLDVAPPRLVASVGTLGAVERTGPGTWKVSYVPPAEGPPQVAVIVAAVDAADEDAVGFLPLPLYGKGATVVHTKPGSVVTVVAGGKSFGPVKADKDGSASVPLVLGPGVKTAVTHALDEAGNQAEKKIDLGVPPFPRVAAIALDEVATADGNGVARVLAVTVDERGAPQEHAPLKVAVSTGGVKVEDDIAPGMRLLVLQPGRTRSGSVSATVTLVGAPDSVSHLEVPLVTGPPAKAEITLSREMIDDHDPDRTITATARLLDAGGHPVPPQAAGAVVDFGRIERFDSDEDGTRRITWIVPAGTHKKRAVLSVHLPSGVVLGEARVKLQGGPPPIKFDPVDFVVADGTSGIDLVVRIRDPSVNNVAVQADPAEGTVGRPTVKHGVVRVRFTPARTETATTAHVRAQAGDDVAEVTVPLAPAPHAGLILGGSLAVESNYSSIVAVGPEVSLVTQVIGPLYAGGKLALLQSVLKPVEDHRAVPLFAEVLWRPAMSPDAQFVVGLDAGPVLSDLVDGGKHTLEVAVGAQAVVGAAWHAGPGWVEAALEAGSAGYVGSGIAAARVGVPFGAGVSVGYRIGL